MNYNNRKRHIVHFIIGAVITSISSKIHNRYLRAIGMIIGSAMTGGIIEVAGSYTAVDVLGLDGGAAQLVVI